ncbi:aspartate 1-decarboxylase [Marispirochaeta sp.]|uniref:aspartate 1-decarboxylase n=1 Tax=Marispirochaeta sp. TaxID=2038653 RepID=UPI0029C7145E|nr:aspartate 1-decarboxylase [Marispirochaeta sp.]
MTIEMLTSKIHRALVTGADPDYIGSISIDSKLIAAAGLREYQKVDVLDITNGARLSTYVIAGGDGEVTLNGAAARLIETGDLVIIAAYADLEEAELDGFKARIVHVDGNNRVVKTETSR